MKSIGVPLVHVKGFSYLCIYIADLLREFCGFAISEGSMVNWVNEAKVKAKPVIEKIKEFIMQSKVVGFDESGCYCNKRLDWAWIAQTVYFTLVFRAEGRGSRSRLNVFERVSSNAETTSSPFLKTPWYPRQQCQRTWHMEAEDKTEELGVFRSDLGADAFLDLHSVVETAKKNGQTAYNAIRALFEAAESPLVPIAE